ncbi:hypothetical protein D9V96_013710 [Zobellia laminariae]|uniref:hypothetical protein n=1 Tax=Zobellia laminariae TaxID=248906 RepID=UPI0012D94BC0
MTIVLLIFGRLEFKVIVPVIPLLKSISLMLGLALTVYIAQRYVPVVPSFARVVILGYTMRP